jgi:hypothetical protein
MLLFIWLEKINSIYIFFKNITIPKLIKIYFSYHILKILLFIKDYIKVAEVAAVVQIFLAREKILEKICTTAATSAALFYHMFFLYYYYFYS